MKYYLNLFSPETYEAFKRSTREISGFTENQRSAAEKIRPGDRLICYLTKLGRWFGVLEVSEGPFVDRTPIFRADDDPFILRFRVRPEIVLDTAHAIPIREKELWEVLSFTKGHRLGSKTWTGRIRGSLGEMDEADARLIEQLLHNQADSNRRTFPYDEGKYQRMVVGRTVRRADRDVPVYVPDDTDDDTDVDDDAVVAPEAVARESHQIQALIADIGARMGMTIWVPRADRTAVERECRFTDQSFADRLPLNYDDVTLSTIENIDVLWLHGRAIVRAFEVEHTTSIYSGILRMADLLALQPNMDIKLHIVAPLAKRDKVFQEIRRPVFSLLEHRPLAETWVLRCPPDPSIHCETIAGLVRL
jgi:predicted RNA-binding protein